MTDQPNITDDLRSRAIDETIAQFTRGELVSFLLQSVVGLLWNLQKVWGVYHRQDEVIRRVKRKRATYILNLKRSLLNQVSE